MKVKLTVEKKELEKQLADAYEDCRQFEEENGDLQAGLAQYRAKDQGEDIDVLAQNHEEIRAEKAKLEEQLQQRKDDNKELRSENNSLKIDKADLKNDVAELGDIEEDLEKEVKKYKKMWNTAENEIEKLEEKLEAKEEEMKERCERIAEEKNDEMNRAVQDAWNNIAEAMEEEEEA